MDRFFHHVLVLAGMMLLAIAAPLPAEVTARPEASGKTAQVKELSVADLSATTKESLVKIVQLGRQGQDGLGSGFVVSEDGLIATNLHVIGEARRLQVELSDGETHEVSEITATDRTLDLALIRIAKKGMKPLVLGDSDKARQGDPVVALGNPEGLDFSVVQGVISATREIDDVPMIQVAIPIERGNSGGPLMDHEGRVLGILTLKSLRTDNLGFAMPVNGLKQLIAKPNPVPMQRWLTIGVLNPRLWQPLFGARWTQHAGVIKTETPGSGFGGRSLCLWQKDKPGDVFEVLVNVRLDDESGAAGLAFCADGGDAHYGFYPSGGKLRLTRFDGPDVYSWTILADVPSDAYRPGEWNQLRVRVDDERIVCYVNGQQVVEKQDATLRGGAAGVCKFRNTTAEFRGFRVGSDLADKQMDPQLAARVRTLLQDYFAESKAARDQAKTALMKDAAQNRRVLATERRALEQRLAAVRELEREIHRRAITQDILTELSKPEDKIDLLRCTLLLARHDNPEIEIAPYLETFQGMVSELKKDPQIRQNTQAAVARLNRYLFQENGFHGSRHDYENRSNSYMNEVIDDREGLPITLSVIYVELAARLGIKGVYGVPLPGKFMVGVQEGPEGELSLIDVFENGKSLTVEQAALELSDTGEFPSESLKPATKRSIILRMLRNLLGGALDDENSFKESLPYLNLVLEIDPEAVMERLTRARVLERLGNRDAAGKDVHWLIEHYPEDGPTEMYDQLSQWLHSLQE